MKSKNIKRLGFTLIELLVVVLIIGILSSIALPKYQKAVKKSRAATVFTQLSPARQALITYKLANPNMNSAHNIDMSNLDVDMPTPKFENFSSCYWQAANYYGGVALKCFSNIRSEMTFALKEDGTRLCCTFDDSCNDYGFGTYYEDWGGYYGRCYAPGGSYTAY